MLPRLLALVLLAAALLPGAAAFAASQDEVAFTFAPDRAPIVLSAGALEVAGFAQGGLVAGELRETRIGPVGELVIVSDHQETRIAGATLVVHDGALIWELNGTTAPIRASAAYAFAFALPQSPFGEEEAPMPGLLLAGPALDATVSWSRGDALLVPFAANVTVLDAGGSAVAAFSRRNVNPEGTAGDAGTAFRATGAFEARFSSRSLLLGVGREDATLRLDVRASAEDRFSEAGDAFQGALDMMSAASGGGGGGGPASPIGAGSAFGNPLAPLAPFAGTLNGAIVILDPPGEDGVEHGALAATLSDAQVDPSPFTLLRSDDLALAWGGGALGVYGTSTLAVTKGGFSTDPPLTLGPIAIISLVLWIGAACAVVYFLVKRPPKSEATVRLRAMSWAVWALVLVVVFVYWDRSFYQTFNTSVLTLATSGGAVGVAKAWMVMGMELLPWTIAGVLFALPVRIMVGVALRYLGQGKSYKRLAAAAGLVSLAIFGPLYALWAMSILISWLVARLPAMMGSG